MGTSTEKAPHSLGAADLNFRLQASLKPPKGRSAGERAGVRNWTKEPPNLNRPKQSDTLPEWFPSISIQARCSCSFRARPTQNPSDAIATPVHLGQQFAGSLITRVWLIPVQFGCAGGPLQDWCPLRPHGTHTGFPPVGFVLPAVGSTTVSEQA
jgi:hypothetical protein